MWCREGVRAESSGMLLARSPSGWDRLHCHDFKREENSRRVSSRGCSLPGGKHQLLHVSFLRDEEKHWGSLKCFHAAVAAVEHLKMNNNTLLAGDRSLGGWQALHFKVTHNCLCHGKPFSVCLFFWLYINKYVYNGRLEPKHDDVESSTGCFRLLAAKVGKAKRYGRPLGQFTGWYTWGHRNKRVPVFDIQTSDTSEQLLGWKSTNFVKKLSRIWVSFQFY